MCTLLDVFIFNLSVTMLSIKPLWLIVWMFMLNKGIETVSSRYDFTVTKGQLVSKRELSCFENTSKTLENLRSCFPYIKVKSHLIERVALRVDHQIFYENNNVIQKCWYDHWAFSWMKFTEFSESSQNPKNGIVARGIIQILLLSRDTLPLPSQSQ